MTVNKISFPLRIKVGGQNKEELTMAIYSHYINVHIRTRLPRLVSYCFSKLPDHVHVRTGILGLSVVVSQTTGPRDTPHRRGSESGLGPLESVTLFTDKSRQEPTRAVKRRQEAFLCIFRLKYYLIDHIYALYYQISHMVAFAAPQNNEFTTR